MTADSPVNVVKGPNGEAEIYEIWAGGRLIEYQVKFGDKVEKHPNIGAAYIAAGEKAGTKT